MRRAARPSGTAARAPSCLWCAGGAAGRPRRKHASRRGPPRCASRRARGVALGPATALPAGRLAYLGPPAHTTRSSACPKRPAKSLFPSVDCLHQSGGRACGSLCLPAPSARSGLAIRRLPGTSWNRREAPGADVARRVRGRPDLDGRPFVEAPSPMEEDGPPRHQRAADPRRTYMCIRRSRCAARSKT